MPDPDTQMREERDTAVMAPRDLPPEITDACSCRWAREGTFGRPGPWQRIESVLCPQHGDQRDTSVDRPGGGGFIEYVPTATLQQLLDENIERNPGRRRVIERELVLRELNPNV